MSRAARQDSTAAAASSCPACGKRAEGRFCTRCGTELAYAGSPARERRAWRVAVVLAALVLLLLPALVWRNRSAAAAGAGPAQPAPVAAELGAPIPRARFDSLHAEMLRLQALGDTAAVRLLADSLLATARRADALDR